MKIKSARDGNDDLKWKRSDKKNVAYVLKRSRADGLEWIEETTEMNRTRLN